MGVSNYASLVFGLKFTDYETSTAITAAGTRFTITPLDFVDDPKLKVERGWFESEEGAFGLVIDLDCHDIPTVDLPDVTAYVTLFEDLFPGEIPAWHFVFSRL
jgi:hypothetical protein